jgi:hypothetical protein
LRAKNVDDSHKGWTPPTQVVETDPRAHYGNNEPSTSLRGTGEWVSLSFSESVCLCESWFGDSATMSVCPHTKYNLTHASHIFN